MPSRLMQQSVRKKQRRMSLQLCLVLGIRLILKVTLAAMQAEHKLVCLQCSAQRTVVSMLENAYTCDGKRADPTTFIHTCATSCAMEFIHGSLRMLTRGHCSLAIPVFHNRAFICDYQCGVSCFNIWHQGVTCCHAVRLTSLCTGRVSASLIVASTSKSSEPQLWHTLTMSGYVAARTLLRCLCMLTTCEPR